MSLYLRSLVFSSHDFFEVKSGWWLVVALGIFLAAYGDQLPQLPLGNACPSLGGWNTRWLFQGFEIAVDGLLWPCLLCLNGWNLGMANKVWGAELLPIKKGNIKDVENIA